MDREKGREEDEQGCREMGRKEGKQRWREMGWTQRE